MICKNFSLSLGKKILDNINTQIIFNLIITLTLEIFPFFKASTEK